MILISPTAIRDAVLCNLLARRSSMLQTMVNLHQGNVLWLHTCGRTSISCTYALLYNLYYARNPTQLPYSAFATSALRTALSQSSSLCSNSAQQPSIDRLASFQILCFSNSDLVLKRARSSDIISQTSSPQSSLVPNASKAADASVDGTGVSLSRLSRETVDGNSGAQALTRLSCSVNGMAAGSS